MNPAIISAGDAIRHFKVQGSLILEDITLIFGYTNGEDGGGGVLIDGVNHKATLRLLRTSIISCESSASGGGGIALKGQSAVLILQERVILTGNKASAGGAIHALNRSTVTVEPGTTLRISGNVAKLSGGGVSLYGSSSMRVQGHNTTILFAQNQVTNQYISIGAGMHLFQAKIDISNGALVNITNNRAALRGGGMVIDNHSAATITGKATRVYVNGNSAVKGTGGGISVEGFSKLNVENSGQLECSNNTALIHPGIRIEYESSIAVSGIGSELFVTDH